MFIRRAVFDAVRLAAKDWGYSGHMHKVFVMTTSPKWSAL